MGKVMKAFMSLVVFTVLNVENCSESIENRFTGRVLMLVDLADKIMVYFVLLLCVWN